MAERDSEADVAATGDANEFDFGSVHSDNFPALLRGLGITLAVTSYQAQRMFFLRSDGREIETSFTFFPRPMGIYADKHRLTLGTLTQVLEFKRNDGILAQIKQGDLDDIGRMTKKVREKDAEHMQQLEEARAAELGRVTKADALYLLRASLTTGMINIHDIAWGSGGLWVVNSTFSCLATLSSERSFVARWKPSFISELVPEDRCHLNGMALKDGNPKYVTTFNTFDSRDSWVNHERQSGTLIDVESDDILVDGLIMPHSPRYRRGKVYLCDSGHGTVLEYDPGGRSVRVLFELQGFPRGINFFGPLMFVGVSKTRPSKTRQALPINDRYEETHCGIWVFDLENEAALGYLRFTGDVEQIYDIAVIPETSHPELLTGGDSLIRHVFDYQEEI